MTALAEPEAGVGEFVARVEVCVVEAGLLGSGEVGVAEETDEIGGVEGEFLFDFEEGHWFWWVDGVYSLGERGILLRCGAFLLEAKLSKTICRILNHTENMMNQSHRLLADMFIRKSECAEPERPLPNTCKLPPYFVLHKHATLEILLRQQQHHVWNVDAA